MRWDHMKSNTLSDGRYYVTSMAMDTIVREFTLVPRHWPAWSADKIETMARWAGVIPADALYQGFDTKNDLLIFWSPQTQVERPKSKFRRWLESVIY